MTLVVVCPVDLATTLRHQVEAARDFPEVHRVAVVVEVVGVAGKLLNRFDVVANFAGGSFDLDIVTNFLTNESFA